MEKKEKPSVGLLIAMKAKKKGDEGKEGKKDYDKMYAESAQEILDAIKGGDAKKLGVLLKSFVKMCSVE